MLCNQSLPKLFSITLRVEREVDSYLYQTEYKEWGRLSLPATGITIKSVLISPTITRRGGGGGGTGISHPQLPRSTDLTSKTIAQTSETVDFLTAQQVREAAKQVSCQMLRSYLCPRATQGHHLWNMPPHTTIAATHPRARPPFLLTNNKRRLPRAI